MTDRRKEEAVAYLLGELDAVQAADFERRLESDSMLRAEYERLGGVVRQLETVPAEVWEAEDLPRLELSVADELPRYRESDGGRSLRNWFSPRRFAFAGALTLAVFGGGVFLGTLVDDPAGESPVTRSVDLRPVEPANTGGGLVQVEQGDGRTGELIVDGLPESRPDSYYELWLLGSRGVVSLGSFTVGPQGHADTPISIPVDPGDYDSFDISLESDDGDPSHSGKSILRGPVDDEIAS